MVNKSKLKNIRIPMKSKLGIVTGTAIISVALSAYAADQPLNRSAAAATDQRAQMNRTERITSPVSRTCFRRRKSSSIC